MALNRHSDWRLALESTSIASVFIRAHMKSVMRSAAMFVLDQCLVLPVNGSGLDFNDGERIVWPAGRAFELGITVEPTQMGVLMKGRQTANQYASLLHGFSYWPPIEIEKRVTDRDLASGLLLKRKFQLICSYNDAGANTDPFTVLLSSPMVAKETSLSKNVIYSDNSRSNPLIGAVPVDNEFVDDDEYDDEDEFDDDPMSAGDPTGAGALQWSPMARTHQRNDPSLQYHAERAQFAHSDKELRPVDALGLHEKDQTKKTGGKINMFGLAVGFGVACFAVTMIMIVFFISKSNGFRRGNLHFLRRGERKAPGRLQFRPEARLNVIENPIEQMEGGKLNWQPPVTTPTPTLSEGLPGVHVPYGARDEQFDAETRSFNGLFEEDDLGDDNTDEEIAAAALEEVDDFDESELSQHTPGATPRHQQEMEGDGEGSEEDEDTSFSVGPNHLDFVTLPGPRHGRGFNPDI
ncbi:hypothetical protein ACTXT7_008872 [Hymenolepis weldensis]